MIKNLLLDSCMGVIKSYYSNYNDNELFRIHYGLECIYMTITKTVVILCLSVILNIFKETILLLIIFNFLRLFGFGLHATKSWMCWVSSTICFLGLPYISKVISIPDYFLVIFSFYFIICFTLHAPADTHKRPLVKKKKRLIYKLLTIITSIFYLLLIIHLDNNILKNLIFFAMLIETVLTHPLVYKLFRLPYNNYKSYVFSK